MGKLEYLDALRRAMAGLEPEIQAKTLAFYEQRFVDGVAVGRTEEDVATELGEPKKIAMTLRANAHMKAFETKKNPANFLRMAFAAIGLVIFNLFMLVPAMVYAALLASLYAAGLAFYLGGTVVTASGLSGANEIRLAGPFSQLFADDDVDAGGELQTKVNISEQGIRIFSERAPEAKAAIPPAADVTVTATDAARNAARAQARSALKDAADEAKAAAMEAKIAAAQAARTGSEAAADAAAQAAAAEVAALQVQEASDKMAAGAGEEDDGKRSVRAIKRAESVASNGILISTDAGDDSRTTQTVIGMAMILGGIFLLLLSLVITRYTLIGIRRYIDMNVALLNGN